MLKKYQATMFIVFVLLSVSNVFAQNKFEGYNLFLDAPETQKVTTCALRYVPPKTEITITDLNQATPMKIINCGQDAAQVQQRGGNNAVMRASDVNYKWCFTGEDKSYRITFKGDQYSGQITYNWIANREATGTYNVKDFGAVGDGATDDTIAFKSAVAFIAAQNGGTLLVPQGDFLISSPITLVSGINIQGVSSLPTGASTNNVVPKSPTRLKWIGKNGSIFRIGECTESIVMKDLELFTENTRSTSGVEAVGAYNSSQNFSFERVTFNGFSRGFYARGLPQTDLSWQFDYVKFDQCRFVFNRDAGIYANVRNSDWKIQSSLFINPPRTATDKADSMTFERAGMVLVQDTYAGGFSAGRGGTFLNILDTSSTTIIGSQAEAMTNSIVYNEVNNPSAGDYSYPLTIINSIFDDPIVFKARRTLVSTGNLYGAETFQADERLRVYSTGDRFCYDGAILGCQTGGGNIKKFDRATIVFMTGQPGEGKIQGFPTVFGTDVQFGSPVQMPSFLQSALPTGKPNGSMIYCSNCRRNTASCQAGGTGAPAMVVNNQWSCL